MAEIFLLPTEQEPVELRRLTFDDAPYYFGAVDANREHLSQFGDETASKYPDLNAVEESIKNPDNPNKLRYGIWDGEQFVGSINLTPDEDHEDAEIGYWIDSRYTGHGYATLATRALAKYAQTRFDRVTADVHADNMASRRVLEKAGFWSIDKASPMVIYEFMQGRVPKCIPNWKTQHFEREGFTGDVYIPKSAEMGFTALQVNVHDSHPRKRISEGNVRSYFVIDGTGTFRVNGSNMPARKGTLFVIQPGDEYSYSGEMTLFEVNVSPDNTFGDEKL